MLSHFIDEETEAQRLSSWPRITQELDSTVFSLGFNFLTDPEGPCPHLVSRLRVEGVGFGPAQRWQRLFPVRSNLENHPPTLSLSHTHTHFSRGQPTRLPAPQAQASGAGGPRSAGPPQDGRKGERTLRQTQNQVFKYTLLNCWAERQPG